MHANSLFGLKYPLTSDDVGPPGLCADIPIKWEESRLAASGGVASSGHPVDGSVRVAEDEGDLCSSFIPRGSSPSTPGWFPVMCGMGRSVKQKK